MSKSALWIGACLGLAMTSISTSLPSIDHRIVEACRSAYSRTVEPAARICEGTNGPAGPENGDTKLTPSDGGEVIYDSYLHVYWLADADFAASPKGREIQSAMSVTGINPNGSMSYASARNWVAALNACDNNRGYLGHNNWQLPVTPLKDQTCGALGPGGASFGGLCQGDALGHLYYRALKQVFPANAAPFTGASVEPFRDVQLAYYWTQTPGGINRTGRQIFSFSSGQADVTEVNDTFYYLWPMVAKQNGPIGGTAPVCSGGSHLAPYTQGPSATQAIYDCDTGISWLANANLAATSNFGITGDLPGGIHYRRPYPRPHPITLNIPQIVGGSMMWDTTQRWISALNAADHRKGYLGSSDWQIPDSPADLKTLYAHLQLGSGDARLMAHGNVGPFYDVQPFFYWETCVADPRESGDSSDECGRGYAPSGKRGREMSFDFTFGYGLLSTDLSALNYFVMVYYPAPAASPSTKSHAAFTAAFTLPQPNASNF